MSIFRILGFGQEIEKRPQSSAETATVRKIVNELDHLDPERARYVAAFAYILSRVAHADMNISREETGAMESIVHELGGLPEEQAIIVVQMAKSQSLLFGGTENFQVTKEFGRMAGKAEKMALLECLFAVSAADDSITTVESNVIRQIADELRLEHADYIEVRSRFRAHLAVLKKPQDPAEQ
jgi:uncharacterized tellurite resistance protein B-like protein